LHPGGNAASYQQVRRRELQAHRGNMRRKRGGDAFASCGAGARKIFAEATKAAGLKNARKIDRIERAYVQETTTHRGGPKRA
jgi:hypothetical protein